MSPLPSPVLLALPLLSSSLSALPPALLSCCWLAASACVQASGFIAQQTRFHGTAGTPSATLVQCPRHAFVLCPPVLPSPCRHAIADLSTELAMIAYEEIEEVGWGQCVAGPLPGG